MKPPRFAYHAPASVDEAIALLARYGGEAKLLAGGQSLVPLLNFRLSRPAALVDLNRIAALAYIREDAGHVRLGAMTRQRTIEFSPVVRRRLPLLAEATTLVGHLPIRSRGTIGGSLAHADPAAEYPTALTALGGQVIVRGPRGERRFAAEEFFLGPLTTAIEPNEILTEIRVPVLQRRCGGAYLKMAQQASGFAIVGVAVSLKVDAKGLCQEIGIGVTGLGDKPFRARAVEERLCGNKLTPKLIEASAAQVAEGIDPLDDLHAAAPFRAHLARVYAARAIQAAAKRTSGKSG